MCRRPDIGKGAHDRARLPQECVARTGPGHDENVSLDLVPADRDALKVPERCHHSWSAKERRQVRGRVTEEDASDQHRDVVHQI